MGLNFRSHTGVDGQLDLWQLCTREVQHQQI